MLWLLPVALATPPPERMLRDDVHVSSGYLSSTAHLGLRIWQAAISPGDGARCPMRPTCSAYAAQSFGAHGVWGFPMTFDRLLRDGNTVGYPLAPDGLHFLDPVDAHVDPADLLTGAHCRRQRSAGADLCL